MPQAIAITLETRREGRGRSLELMIAALAKKKN